MYEQLLWMIIMTTSRSSRRNKIHCKYKMYNFRFNFYVLNGNQSRFKFEARDSSLEPMHNNCYEMWNPRNVPPSTSGLTWNWNALIPEPAFYGHTQLAHDLLIGFHCIGCPSLIHNKDSFPFIPPSPAAPLPCQYLSTFLFNDLLQFCETRITLIRIVENMRIDLKKINRKESALLLNLFSNQDTYNSCSVTTTTGRW